MTPMEKLYLIGRFLWHNEEKFKQWIFEDCLWRDGKPYDWFGLASSNEELRYLPIDEYRDEMKKRAYNFAETLIKELKKEKER